MYYVDISYSVDTVEVIPDFMFRLYESKFESVGSGFANDLIFYVKLLMNILFENRLKSCWLKMFDS